MIKTNGQQKKGQGQVNSLIHNKQLEPHLNQVLNTKKPASHVSIDYESKLMQLVEHQEDSDHQALDHLQITLEGDAEFNRGSDRIYEKGDKEQLEAIDKDREFLDI